MRIAINCRSFVSQSYTGIGRYAHHLVKNLGEIDQTNEYCLYVRKRLFDFKRKLPALSYSNFCNCVDYFKKGIAKTIPNVDVYHYPSPDRIDVNHDKIVVTVHDLIYKAFPQGHTPSAIEASDQQFQDIVAKASKIICCSKSTRDDLHRFFDVDPARSVLIYQGVDNDTFFPLSESDRDDARTSVEKKGIVGSYLLFVGTIEPRKNLSNILQAMSYLKKKKHLRKQLVVIGMKGWISSEFYHTIKELDLKDDVKFMGYLSNQELNNFYNLAEMLLFPSFYEGFGFPIVEAFRCHTPVITSNVSSCPEVAGDAALLVDPHSFQEIAEAIVKISQDRKLRKRLVHLGFERAKEFCFRKTAQETLKVYEEVGQF